MDQAIADAEKNPPKDEKPPLEKPNKYMQSIAREKEMKNLLELHQKRGIPVSESVIKIQEELVKCDMEQLRLVERVVTVEKVCRVPREEESSEQD